MRLELESIEEEIGNDSIEAVADVFLRLQAIGEAHVEVALGILCRNARVEAGEGLVEAILHCGEMEIVGREGHQPIGQGRACEGEGCALFALHAAAL